MSSHFNAFLSRLYTIISNYIDDNSIYFFVIPFFFITAYVIYKLSLVVIRRFIIPIVLNIPFLYLKRAHLDDSKLFSFIAYLAPLSILYSAFQYLSLEWVIVERIILVFFVYFSCRIFDAALNLYFKTYVEKNGYKRKAVKSYLQFFKIILYIIGFIFIISILLDKSPVVFLSSLGAITAVLLFIFRSTIVGLITSLQINANNLIQVGDWIEIPHSNIDGEVIEMTLYTIKIKGFDNTISVFPLESLQHNFFRNWQSMIDSGGRRIKRSLLIDVTSIGFLNYDKLKKLRDIELIKAYVDEKLQSYTDQKLDQIQSDYELLNLRTLTNIGTFRLYILRYIHEHPKIHNTMTYMIRQKQPTAEGLPIEIYAFANDVNWENYEQIQSDIFDHLLAAAQAFDLKIYQKPSGSDFKQILP